ncbi:hypothetical protein DL766_001879 [Monosporascus sp. MC13-8B]|uniref:Ubiquitin-like protease family profile domain-containing protein n=1 Tax=Monosporascus cannonballus TaxID=155416 RepID=A0ABY0GT23_9PEZI|nr:hypothetical protein DL762_009675 [Monosporascus cannonballus]RYO78148.1 hypothetical protein DL763_009763 [Monosporascus cannonballus]RYP36639.1 hypothetical protein DL766_001879 [Monosporascus sp. MC13-8B]
MANPRYDDDGLEISGDQKVTHNFDRQFEAEQRAKDIVYPPRNRKRIAPRPGLGADHPQPSSALGFLPYTDEERASFPNEYLYNGGDLKPYTKAFKRLNLPKPDRPRNRSRWYEVAYSRSLNNKARDALNSMRSAEWLNRSELEVGLRLATRHDQVWVPPEINFWSRPQNTEQLSWSGNQKAAYKSHNFLVIPCNTQPGDKNGMHWQLVIFDKKRKMVYFADSMYNPSKEVEDRADKQVVNEAIINLRHLLIQKGIGDPGVLQGVRMYPRRQPEYWECGYVVIEAARAFVQEDGLLNWQHSKFYRRTPVKDRMRALIRNIERWSRIGYRDHNDLNKTPSGGEDIEAKPAVTEKPKNIEKPRLPTPNSKGEDIKARPVSNRKSKSLKQRKPRIPRSSKGGEPKAQQPLTTANNQGLDKLKPPPKQTPTPAPEQGLNGYPRLTIKGLKDIPNPSLRAAVARVVKQYIASGQPVTYQTAYDVLAVAEGNEEEAVEIIRMAGKAGDNDVMEIPFVGLVTPPKKPAVTDLTTSPRPKRGRDEDTDGGRRAKKRYASPKPNQKGKTPNNLEHRRPSYDSAVSPQTGSPRAAGSSPADTLEAFLDSLERNGLVYLPENTGVHSDSDAGPVRIQKLIQSLRRKAVRKNEQWRDHSAQFLYDMLRKGWGVDGALQMLERMG